MKLLITYRNDHGGIRHREVISDAKLEESLRVFQRTVSGEHYRFSIFPNFSIGNTYGVFTSPLPLDPIFFVEIDQI